MNVEAAGVAAVDLDDQEVSVFVVRLVVLVLSFELQGEEGLFLFGRPGNARQFLGAGARVDLEQKGPILIADGAELDRGVRDFQTRSRLKSARARAPPPVRLFPLAVRKRWKAPREGCSTS